MTKKLLAFASVAVFSFGVAVASEVAAPVVVSQDMVTALVEAKTAVAAMSAQEIEAVVQSLKEDSSFSANNGTVEALLEQAQALSGTEVGSVTLGMLAAVAIAYYALPYVYNKAVKPAGRWIQGKYQGAVAARAEKRRLAAEAAAHKAE